MFGTVLSPLVERVKVLLATRAVQELEADFVAGTTGRPAALEKLAAAWQAAGRPWPRRTRAGRPRRPRRSCSRCRAASRGGSG